MAKQCPDCHTRADDDLGYCGACGCPLQKPPVPSLWPYLAVVAVAGSLAAGILSILRNVNAH
jgi:hypothetical protein